ncbi:LysE family translocator [Kordiimonas sp.]|uniref:LysE family translocator n=1 Tax=Kordiimonas sp. TaxID=1970157 RepID=UPI003A8DC444
METLGPLLLSFLAYVIGTASPGPAILTIMMTAAGAGRAAGLRLAAGVMTGSVLWGIAATLGLSVVMSEVASALFVLKFVGGAYLLWLAYKSFCAALQPDQQAIGSIASEGYFLKGLLLHLTNPKAVLVWGSILTIGMNEGSPVWVAPTILVVCSLLGAVVFTVYAFVFSTRRAMTGYLKARRPVQAACGLLFGAAGLKLVLSRT